ncbi:MAG: hypothetical protein QNJ70_25985 [Xenococcaceae cyanobacterium MO_207.B15]|nr:hypothetical protein [Xenococcaceae cyanobacterium MO_207.B15]MDJ0742962.1 hypothetical protein [Xenococcaceae cyanobacterium MO_167.B27]
MNDATDNIFSSDSASNSNSQDSLQSQEQIQSDSEPKSLASTEETTQASDASHNKIDWQQLAHKLREHNRKLLKKVFNLEQNLIDVTNQVQKQTELSRQKEFTITEQTEKLHHSQEEVADLLQQLEKEQQEIKSQQVLIENLSQQLQTSQQQAAKLERECAIIQENYNQKNSELLSLTEQKKELEFRLYRQQQKTLQYKAVLEKYNAIEKPLEKLPSIKLLSQINHQPIQPWSDNSEELRINNMLPNLTNSETDKIVEKSPDSESLETPQIPDWPAPEIAKTSTEKPSKSIAGVKLPKFQKANK